MKVQLIEHAKPKKTTRLDYARGLLVMRQIPYKQVAESIGVTESCVNHVLKGRSKSRRVLQAVANILEMTFEELWS